jgi:enhancing lycopene biosynthesis protein 2
MARIGLLLSGCGRYDGTEIHEAVLAVLALDRLGARVEFLAPAAARAETVDHATGQLVPGDTRSVIAEAARIARGHIRPLSDAETSILSGLIIPGGQGVVRNLMTGVGESGRRREADPEVARMVKVLLEQRRPIGTISLAGSLVATILGLPLEEDPFSTPPTEIRVDEERGLVWTPGFLSGDRISDVARGIDAMTAEVVRRASKGLEVLG